MLGILHINRKYSKAVGRILAVSAAVALLHSCSGTGCRRHVPDVPVPIDQDQSGSTADEILATPAVFDQREIEDVLRVLNSGRPLTDTEKARAIVTAESAINRLGQMLEMLDRNDDVADTWNSLNELYQLDWPRQSVAIVNALTQSGLDPYESQRVADMEKALEFNRGMIRHLQKQNRHMPSPYDNPTHSPGQK